MGAVKTNRNPWARNDRIVKQWERYLAAEHGKKEDVNNRRKMAGLPMIRRAKS
jgi:hypothetical protein